MQLYWACDWLNLHESTSGWDKDYLCKIHNVDESTTYEEARLQLKTDYDRQNQILKDEALVKFKKEYRESKKYLLMKGVEHEMH